jgi:hypothetical protein
MLEAIGCGLGATFLNLDESGIGLDLLSWATDLLKRDFVLTPCVGKNSVQGNVVIVVELELQGLAVQEPHP